MSKKKEKIPDFRIGDCFKCGLNFDEIIEKVSTRGYVDGIPVYIDCPRCKAINSYIERYRAWKEKYGQK